MKQQHKSGGERHGCSAAPSFAATDKDPRSEPSISESISINKLVASITTLYIDLIIFVSRMF